MTLGWATREIKGPADKKVRRTRAGRAHRKPRNLGAHALEISVDRCSIS